MRTKHLLAAALIFALGIGCGGFLFARSVPRSLLALGECGDHCFAPSEIAGLITSAALMRAPFVVPKVQMESDTCLAIRHPRPEAPVHYVLFPKHDTRNIATLTPQDTPYVLGCFAMARELIARDHLRGYWLRTNGPGLQEIAYLHFHLLAR